MFFDFLHSKNCNCFIFRIDKFIHVPYHQRKKERGNAPVSCPPASLFDVNSSISLLTLRRDDVIIIFKN